MRTVSRFFAILMMVSMAVAVTAGDGGANQVDGRYVNESGPWDMKIGAAIKAQLTTEQVDKSPRAPLPLSTVDIAALRAAPGPLLYRLGHSTILLKLDGRYVLIDPVFSERASPLQWVGPKRFHPVPLELTQLPRIDAVVISHDHYDHLDEGSIRFLADRADYFFTPLGVGDHLRRWGIADDAIVEFGWWDEVELGTLTFAATPAQHFSGRGLFDRNKTLWASWVIQSPDANLFFSGDTGYFPGFREIGERYGPFDIAMVENGAYNPAWRDIHMMPEDTLQAFKDLNARAMLPIHNSTFDLSLHAWYEPLERISALAMSNDVQLLTPVIGAPLDVTAPQPTFAWWQDSVRARNESIAARIPRETSISIVAEASSTSGR